MFFFFLEADPTLTLPTLADIETLNPATGDALAMWQYANSLPSTQWIVSINYSDFAPETSAFVLPVVENVIPLRTRGWGRRGAFCIDFLVTCRVRQVGNNLRLAVERELKRFWMNRGRTCRNVVVSSVDNYKKKMLKLYAPTFSNIARPSTNFPLNFEQNPCEIPHGMDGESLSHPTFGGLSRFGLGSCQRESLQCSFPRPSTSAGPIPPFDPFLSHPPSTWGTPTQPPSYWHQRLNNLPTPSSSALQQGGGMSSRENSKRKRSSSRRESAKKRRKPTNTNTTTNENETTESPDQTSEPQPSTSSKEGLTTTPAPPASSSTPSTSAPQPGSSVNTNQSSLPSFVDRNCERCVLFFTLGKDSTRAHAPTCQNHKPRKQRVKKPQQPNESDKKNTD